MDRTARAQRVAPRELLSLPTHQPALSVHNSVSTTLTASMSVVSDLNLQVSINMGSVAGHVSSNVTTFHGVDDFRRHLKEELLEVQEEVLRQLRPLLVSVVYCSAIGQYRADHRRAGRPCSFE